MLTLADRGIVSRLDAVGKADTGDLTSSKPPYVPSDLKVPCLARLQSRKT